MSGLLNLGAAHDEKERAGIEARRQRDAARRERFLGSPKARVIGVDAAALDAQVAERRAREAEEKAMDRAYDAYLADTTRQATIIDAHVQRERKAMQRDLASFWGTQDKSMRREFDLYDPHGKARDLPARTGDDDARCGPSSLQRFDGEDLSASERKRLQGEQMRAWVAAQHAEKVAREQQEKDEAAAYDRYAEDLAFQAHSIEQSVHEERRRIGRELADENLRLAAAKREAEMQRRREEEAAAEEEIQRTLTDPYLNETQGTTLSAADPNRFRPDHFKHLRPDQYAAIEEERLRQVRAKEEARQKEKREEANWAAYQAEMQRTAQLVERDVQRQRAQMARELAQEQKMQAEEKRQRYDALLNGTYVNKVDDSFFAQFGTSAR